MNIRPERDGERVLRVRVERKRPQGRQEEDEEQFCLNKEIKIDWKNVF